MHDQTSVYPSFRICCTPKRFVCVHALAHPTLVFKSFALEVAHVNRTPKCPSLLRKEVLLHWHLSPAFVTSANVEGMA